MWRIIKITVLSLLAVIVIGFLVWAHVVSPADSSALERVRNNPTITMRETAHSFVIRPAQGESTVGLVFIPGAKVDPRAYAYKLSALSESFGMTVVITKPYFNLAITDLRPFGTFINDIHGVRHWLVGGHSLGGVKACSYAGDGRNEIKGLILFAAYCTSPVSVQTLSLRGEFDGLTSADDVSNAQQQISGPYQYIEIEGANHASFGDYGVQKGDGTATISSEDMRMQIQSDIADWLPPL